MDNQVNNIFDKMFPPQTSPHIPKEEEKAQEQPVAKVKTATESDRKAYSEYRQAVFNYATFIDRKNKAAQALEQHKKQQSAFPDQLQKLEQERNVLLKGKADLEGELKKQQQGDESAVLKLKNVQCDSQIAAMIRHARDAHLMTANQYNFMNKSCEEVCSGKVLNSVDVLEGLETSFKNNNYHNLLFGGIVSPEIVKQLMTKIALALFGGMFLLLMIARFTAGSSFSTILEWICGFAVAGIAGFYGYGFMSSSDARTRKIVTAVVALMGLFCGGILFGVVTRGPWITSIIFSLLLSGAFSFALNLLAKNKFILSNLQKIEYVKSLAQKEAFKKYESVAMLNEAMYCYCNHEKIMEYFRNNAKLIWIRQLEASIGEKAQQATVKEKEIQAIQSNLEKSNEELIRLQDQMSVVEAEIKSANTSITAWDGQPDMEMVNYQFSDVICMGDCGEPVVIEHGISPIVFYYNGDNNNKNPVGQFADQLANLINSFTRMNPSALMRISLIDMVSGHLALRMDKRFNFINLADLKNFEKNKSDVFSGGVFRVSNREELKELYQQLEDHCRSMEDFTSSHIQQIEGRYSDIKQINKLLVAAGQEPKKYHVIAIVVPRENDRDELGQDSIASYLQDTENSKHFGILPVFFVNESSIHKTWKDTIANCKRNIRRI